MPTKSQVLHADPHKVLDLIDGWKTTVATLEQQAETYLAYVKRPGGSYWEGRTAEAAQQRSRQDLEAITHVRDAVDAAAQTIANTVSSKLMPPLANAKQIIENAESHAGVTVNEDLSITYTAPEGTSKETADQNAKTVAAAEAELKAEAATWWAAENEVASQIRDAQATIGKDLNFAAALYDPRRAMPTSGPAGQLPGPAQAVLPPLPSQPQTAVAPSGLGELLGAEPGSGPPTWQDMLLPTGAPGAGGKPDAPRQPGSLPDLLTQLSRPGAPATRVPIPPQDVEAFKTMARETLRAQGVPPAQIEQQLDAAVARAQALGFGHDNLAPQPHSRGPVPPAPGFAEGFGDRWRATEKMIQNLLGVGERGDPGILESWAGLAKGLAEQFSDPLGMPAAAIRDEVTGLLNSPSPAYYAGGHAADAAMTAPSLLFGGEGAAVRAGLPAEILTEGGAPLAVLRGWDPAGGLSWHDFEARFGTPESRIWPGNDGFPPGYVPQPAHLPGGTIIDRFGSEYGRYLAPDGTPFGDRALMPESVGGDYNRYMVTGKPLPPGWQIVEGPVAPWFGQTPTPGTTQYMIVGPDGVRVNVKELLDRGILDDYGPPLGR